MIRMIAAVNPDFIIGKTNGDIPWAHKGDQRLFKETTQGSVVIMGRVTWEAIPKKYRPLKDRTNVVISSTLPQSPYYFCFPNLLEAFERFRNQDIWLIGGARIYEEGFPFCQEIHLTSVPDKFPLSYNLVYFPENCLSVLMDPEWECLTSIHPYNKKLILSTYTKNDQNTAN